MNLLFQKLKEVMMSVLPISVLVLIINFTLVQLEIPVLVRFIIGVLLIIIGLTLFFIGVEMGITPLGNTTGELLAKTNKVSIVLVGGFVLGFFISIAEPGLMVLANQVGMVTSNEISAQTLLIVVSIGLAIMVSLGFLRIFYNVALRKVLLITYALIFFLAIFTSREFLAISFDASGATTGVLAVPFILALSMGVSKLNKDSKASEENSFGMLAMASAGAIIGVMLLDIFTESKRYSTSLEVAEVGNSEIIKPFIRSIGLDLREAMISLAPLLVILVLIHLFFHKFRKRDFRQLMTGIGFTFIGLTLFLSGVNNGFMDVGTIIGSQLVNRDTNIEMIIVSFVLGLVTILAEPAVYVQTKQIEDVTVGYIKKSMVLVPLSLGVGIAVALAVVRIITPGLELIHLLVPGYIIALGLMFFVPKIFVGIAFDAGGVATGPMTATFTLAFVQGVANAKEGADLLIDGFGMIALVAMLPIITLQILGLIFQRISKKREVENA